MKPGNLIFEYFGALFFISYGHSLDMTVDDANGHYRSAYRSVFIKNELIDAMGCIDSELM
jgi:hypothetical protein